MTASQDAVGQKKPQNSKEFEAFSQAFIYLGVNATLLRFVLSMH
jgi:hypothetical protein